MAMLAGVTVTITGCGSGEPFVTPDPPLTDRTAAVTNNHGHVVTITSAQQKAGGNVTLNIQGTGSHDHVLELTAAEVSTIRVGAKVQKDCGMSRSHVHTITFNA